MPLFYIPTRGPQDASHPRPPSPLSFPSIAYLASLTDQQLRRRISHTKSTLDAESTRYNHLRRRLDEQLRRVDRTKEALRAQDSVVERATDIKDAYVAERKSREDERARRRNDWVRPGATRARLSVVGMR
ncbi:hypothetical protein CLCR_09266 [Cladophialophora carrionii]|uniref:Uncharacterized protein n=1 Tax=Cladophialophora carrionii TaxID=86049 RepID=A0A1C1CST7_9EURO|nr:hypothetical protein CLCR_09266 [Cladophialophora carrionii]